ncbi:MAG: hypothetical protein FWC39_00995 [Bacteroidetes bacterium]|nr:hypothetical protein [Bacteroidota bacterium]
MKKVFLISTGIFLIICNVQAQDLIVTHSGDSINCKITKTTKEYIYFTFKHNEEIRNTLLPANQIATQQKDYFSVSEVPANYTLKDIFPHFRVAIDGGWHYRTAKPAPGLNATWLEHYRKMRPGFHYDLQAAYFFTESMGIEAMFSQQFFGNTLSSYITDADGNVTDYGRLHEKIVFNYIGANYIIRLFDSQKKNSWLFAFGFGYMGFNDRLFFNNVERMKLTANTVGVNTAIGYDIGLSENFGIGFKLSLMGGSFNNFTQTRDGITTNETIPDNNFEGLGTVKLSVGLRFNK